jgi:general secretion pathway protein A
MLALLANYSHTTMYTQFFRLAQTPFSIAPDPRYVFMSERHREALAHLLYGVNGGGGFVLLTGEIGAGKTTICRCFLEQVPANCNVAYIFNPKLSVRGLLRTICEEFHIAPPHAGGGASIKDYVDALNRFLLAAYAEGRNSVLIIDEAQNLSADVLEQLRLLTNLETNERKLLQIILIGQPELRTMLARPELEQLAQRVIARYHLGALSEAETAGYIAHRLTVAGLTSAPPFRPKLMKTIHRLTKGVPRRINLLCDRALLGAYAENKLEVDRHIVGKAAREVMMQVPAKSNRSPYPALFGIVLLAAMAGASAWMLQQRIGTPLRGGSAAPVRMPEKPVAAAPKPASAAAPIASSPAAAPASAAAAPQPAGMAAIAGTEEQDALRRLALLWGVALQGGDPCQAARSHNLHCYTSAEGFAELRQLDRPAVMRLREEDGTERHGVLIGLNNASATLQVGAERRTVSVMQLARQFDGKFTTLWRVPQTYRGRIEFGDRGAEVDWLATQLSRLGGNGAPPSNLPFDPKMARQVREFQFAQGLKIDGLVGPRTIMQLNRAAGVDEPHLDGKAQAATTWLRN